MQEGFLPNGHKRINPLLPTAFICRDPSLEAFFTTPMLDLGTQNDFWKGSGAIWFTHTTTI
jgi:hypothetical protein